MITRSDAGVLALVIYGHCRRRLAGCASCERVRPLVTRGLCDTCRHRYERDGTIGEWGYVKADRVADYARLRLADYPVPVAASRIGVSERTAWRYEAQLRGAAA